MCNCFYYFFFFIPTVNCYILIVMLYIYCRFKTVSTAVSHLLPPSLASVVHLDQSNLITRPYNSQFQPNNVLYLNSYLVYQAERAECRAQSQLLNQQNSVNAEAHSQACSVTFVIHPSIHPFLNAFFFRMRCLKNCLQINKLDRNVYTELFQ